MVIIEDLEYITNEYEGLGGEIKAEPWHFKVNEIPLYEASNTGPHLYITIEKENLNTLEVLNILSKTFNLKKSDLGYAGLKDKNAITTQTISLNNIKKEFFLKTKNELPFKILNIKYHNNKLKIGHLLANKFEIILKTENKNLDLALKIATKIKTHGLANFFGNQRFGENYNNIKEALKIINKPKKKDKFILSALQSYIYNIYLNKRIKNKLFNKILPGELCKKYNSGGIFISENELIEQNRYDDFEISSTGPIFGSKMPYPKDEALKFEEDILKEINIENINNCGQGSRRFNRLLVNDLTVEKHILGFLIKFTLAKGAYATIVLREFIK